MHRLLRIKGLRYVIALYLLALFSSIVYADVGGIPYLIITDPDFETALTGLVQHRINEGYLVTVRTTDWIYSHYGNPNDNDKHLAIKDYITDEYYGTNRPEYVFLVGDVEFDVDLNTGELEYIIDKMPIYITIWHDGNSFLYDINESEYALIDGNDRIPDIALGRLPARTVDEVNAYVSKIIEYEQLQDQPWQSNFVFTINDSELSPCEDDHQMKYDQADYTFDFLSNFGMDGTELRSDNYQYWAWYDPFNDYNTLLTSGASIVFHNGSSGVSSQPYFLTENDGEHPNQNTDDLTNTGKYPLYLAANCLNCCFYEDEDHPTLNYCDQIGEAYLYTPNRGAICVYGNTESGNQLSEWMVIEAYVRELVMGSSDTVGEAYTNSRKGLIKQKRIRSHRLETFVLLGDPALKYSLPIDYHPELISGWPVLIDGNKKVNITTFPSTVIEPDVKTGYELTDMVFSANVTIGNTVYSYNSDSSSRFALGTGLEAWPVLTGDIDANGVNELVNVTSEHGSIFVYKDLGQPFNGFPVTLSDDIDCPPALADLNNDGRLDIVVASHDYVYAVDYEGEFLNGWNGIDPGVGYIYGIAAGDIDGDGKAEIAVTGEDLSMGASLQIIDDDGSLHWSTPASGLAAHMVSPPTLLNLDNEPDLEIIFGIWPIESKEEPEYECLYCFKDDGSEPFYFPNELWVYEEQAPSRDMASPGLVGSTPGIGKFYWVKGKTFSISSNGITWLDSGLGSYDGASIADVDGQPGVEVLFGANGKLNAYHIAYQGGPVDGWNGQLQGGVTIPAVCDLNEDGMTDIVVGDSEAVYAFTTDTPYDESHLSMDWPRTLHDNLNTNNYEIFAPTNVVAEDVPDDQGYALHISWMPSLDDGGGISGEGGGGRSNRVDGYCLYRMDASGSTKLYNETAPDGNSELSHISAASDALGKGGEEPREAWELIADDILPGEYEYTDGYEIDPLDEYAYYLLAYENIDHSLPGYKRYSTKSITDGATAHDNIAPAPPTDAEYQWGNPGPFMTPVTITWELSPDDPNYEPSKGDSGDRLSKLLYISDAVNKEQPSFKDDDPAIRSGNTNDLIKAKLAEANTGKSGVYTNKGNFAESVLSGDEVKRKLADAGTDDKRDISKSDNRRDVTDNTLPDRSITPDVSINDDGKDSKDNKGGEEDRGDVENYIIMKEVDFGGSIADLPIVEVEAGIDYIVAYIPNDEVPNIVAIKVAAKDLENTSEYAYATEITFKNVAMHGDAAFDSLSEDKTAMETSGVHPRTFAEPVAFPNPTTGAVSFGWPVKSESSDFEVTVYDISGRKIWASCVGQTNQVNWDGSDSGGRSISEGVYIIRIEAEAEKYTLKLVKE